MPVWSTLPWSLPTVAAGAVVAAVAGVSTVVGVLEVVVVDAGVVGAGAVVGEVVGTEEPGADDGVAVASTLSIESSREHPATATTIARLTATSRRGCWARGDILTTYRAGDGGEPSLRGCGCAVAPRST